MTSHIAGLDVRCGNQLRQRCAWCSAVLIDDDLSLLRSTSDEPCPTWPVGAVVAVNGDLPTGGWASMRVVPEDEWPTSISDPSGKALPADCCAVIDPAVTR